MAIYLRTGNPGAGKTINTLDEVITTRDEMPDRKVYFYNITFHPEHELYPKIQDWIPLSSDDLTRDLPLLLERDEEGTSSYVNAHPNIEYGSIVLVDEAQDLYPTRTGSQKMPSFLKFFERHRHAGLDFYIITQKPRQIDIHLRELAGHHIHYERSFGLEAVKKLEHNKVIEDLNKIDDSITVSRSVYPKRLYGLYKSAAVHTHKRKLPKRLVYGLPFVIFLILAMGFILYHVVSSFGSSDTEKQPSNNSGSTSTPLFSSSRKNLFEIEKTLTFLYEVEFQGSTNAYFLYEADSLKATLDLFELNQIGFPLIRLSQGIYVSENGFVISKKTIKEEH